MQICEGMGAFEGSCTQEEVNLVETLQLADPEQIRQVRKSQRCGYQRLTGNSIKEVSKRLRDLQEQDVEVTVNLEGLKPRIYICQGEGAEKIWLATHGCTAEAWKLKEGVKAPKDLEAVEVQEDA